MKLFIFLLAICLINGSDGRDRMPGAKGQKGEQGLRGPRGEPGDRGEKGYKGGPGLQGMPGFPGPKGDRGTLGLKGNRGFQTAKGYVGEDGLDGDPGMQGSPGQKGEKGYGLPGRDASCSCPFKNKDLGAVEDGTEVFNSCKFLKKGTLTGKYLVHKPDPFEVICDMERKRTCIPLKNRANSSVIDGQSITHKHNPFWVSEIGLDLLKIYGVTENRLEWLVSQSTFTNLEITYHCKNSYIIPKDKNVDGALQLMSWKETVIGPHPSENSPHFYVVSTENDGCKDSGDHKKEWKQSTIQISSRLKVLPITDFYIQDIRQHEEQQFYLELKELCFNF